MERDYDRLIKIIIIGDSATGKSSLINRYTDKTYHPGYVSTIGIDFKIKRLFLNNKDIKCQIWDTAGQERFQVIINGYYRKADIVFIVFDLSSRDTFDSIDRWYNEAINNTLADTKIVLIGCKSDLKWHVSRDEIDHLAKTYNIPWYTCSSKDDIGISDIFISTIESLTLESTQTETETSTHIKTNFNEFKIDKNCCRI